MANFLDETLEKDTIIRIHNLMPRKLVSGERTIELRDGFLLMVREGSELMAIQDLGFEPSETEAKQLKKYISDWGGGENISIQNGILEMEFPQFLKPMVNAIFQTPGCRITPNLLRLGGDVLLSIEYPKILTEEVNKMVLDFLSQEHLFKKELVYDGPKKRGIPVLLEMYKDAGHSLSDFVVVTTAWEFDEKTRREENQGVFLNTGFYVPKGYVDGSSDTLIFHKNEKSILGSANYTVVDPQKNIVEFNVSSNFFNDFFTRVAKVYTGPIFMRPVVQDSKQITHHIIEKRREKIFLKAIQEHWRLEVRKDHINYIQSVESLDYVQKELDGQGRKEH